MTEKKCCYQQEDITDLQYHEMEKKLFSSSTSVSDLEKICMTLAHIPTQHAQNLLNRFKNSDRAQELDWLDEAVEEGQYHYLSPQDDQEERDYLALKVMQEMEEEIIDLQIKHDEAKLDFDKMAIKQEAVIDLVKKGELDESHEIGFHDINIMLTSRIEELSQDIIVKEKTLKRIKKSIKTERYKNLDPMVMKQVNFS